LFGISAGRDGFEPTAQMKKIFEHENFTSKAHICQARKALRKPTATHIP